MEARDKTALNDPWKINSLRYTIFPKPDYSFDEDLWQELVGTPPENISYKLNRQVKHYDGVYKSGRLAIDVDPSRIHLVFTPSNNPDEISPNSLILGPYDDSIIVFSQLVEDWLALPNCPTVNRVAFGGILIIPVESRIDGYKCLARYLHAVKIDPENSSDFLYQINLPRESNIFQNGLIINRLLKWSVMDFKTSIQEFGENSFSHRTISHEFGVRLEFDINTHVDNQLEFTSSDQREIFKELLHLGKEISENGDI